MTSRHEEIVNVPDPVGVIDAANSDNPLFCEEYANDIYQYMRAQEVTISILMFVLIALRCLIIIIQSQRKYHVLPTYMIQQPQINSEMRAELIDWLIQVHHIFTLCDETLYLTVSIIDRYLSVSLYKLNIIRSKSCTCICTL